MTQEDFVARYHHALWGIMLDVSRTGLTGSQRSILEHHAMVKIDSCLGEIYREMTGMDACLAAMGRELSKPVNGNGIHD